MLGIIDQQAFPALGNRTGDAFTKPEREIFEPRTGIAPGLWTQ